MKRKGGGGDAESLNNSRIISSLCVNILPNTERANHPSGIAWKNQQHGNYYEMGTMRKCIQSTLQTVPGLGPQTTYHALGS